MKMKGDQVPGPVPVTWRLEGGEPTGPLRLGILGMLGTPTLQCVSLTSPIVEPTSEVEVTSYLPGSISLFASDGNRSSQALITIKRPVLILNLSSVAGSGFSSTDISKYYSTAKEIWEREGLIELRRRGEHPQIPEPDSGFTPDQSTGERIFGYPYVVLKPALKNPIVYDEFINLAVNASNTIWPVPRLSKELLSLNRVETKDINVYFVERVLACKFEAPINFITPSGFTISMDEFRSLPTLNPIDDYTESGVLIPKISDNPKRIASFDLAHELGHILMEYGQEHGPHPEIGIKLEADNLMNQGATGVVLAAWQFYLVLDYDSKKVRPFFQEVQDEKR